MCNVHKFRPSDEKEAEKMKKLFSILLFSIIVFSATGSVTMAQVYVYAVTKLTDNSYEDMAPNINDNGYVVWQGSRGSHREIFLYDGTTTTQITDNSLGSRSPGINNNGYVVWYEWDGLDYEIFLYDGTTITQLTNNSYDDKSPGINDNGYVVWYGWDGTDDEIFLYDGTTITQITDNNDDNYPGMNNNGHVVWSGFDGTDDEIFLYDGTTTTQITNNDYRDRYPEINDNGYVAWKAGEGKFNSDLFVYDGTTTVQIRIRYFNDKYPRINNNGYVVWYALDNTTPEIFLGVPTVPSYQCSIVPDSTIVSKGSSLGFEVTVTNNTDEVQTFLFATNVSLPTTGRKYPPPPAYLRGPFRVSLDPYESISRHLSQYVGGTAPPRTYRYHGYVGTGAVGIYQECQFEFEIIE
jgi:hypothetical protein